VEPALASMLWNSTVLAPGAGAPLQVRELGLERRWQDFLPERSSAQSPRKGDKEGYLRQSLSLLDLWFTLTSDLAGAMQTPHMGARLAVALQAVLIASLLTASSQDTL
jgi:hypothetical protein